MTSSNNCKNLSSSSGFIWNKMKDLSVLDSGEEYPNLMGLCAKYNSIKIFKMLEEHLKI